MLVSVIKNKRTVIFHVPEFSKSTSVPRIYEEGWEHLMEILNTARTYSERNEPGSGSSATWGSDQLPLDCKRNYQDSESGRSLYSLPLCTCSTKEIRRLITRRRISKAPVTNLNREENGSSSVPRWSWEIERSFHIQERNCFETSRISSAEFGSVHNDNNRMHFANAEYRSPRTSSIPRSIEAATKTSSRKT